MVEHRILVVIGAQFVARTRPVHACIGRPSSSQNLPVWGISGLVATPTPFPPGCPRLRCCCFPESNSCAYPGRAAPLFALTRCCFCRHRRRRRRRHHGMSAYPCAQTRIPGRPNPRRQSAYRLRAPGSPTSVASTMDTVGPGPPFMGRIHCASSFPRDFVSALLALFTVSCNFEVVVRGIGNCRCARRQRSHLGS